VTIGDRAASLTEAKEDEQGKWKFKKGQADFEIELGF
jgi:hypothetical protein